jgi:hypothetical protein
MDVVNETMFTHPDVRPKIKPGRKTPSYRKRAAYTRMLLGLVYLGIFVVLGPTFNFAAGLKPEFLQKNLLTRFAASRSTEETPLMIRLVGSSLSSSMGLLSVASTTPSGRLLRYAAAVLSSLCDP